MPQQSKARGSAFRGRWASIDKTFPRSSSLCSQMYHRVRTDIFLELVWRRIWLGDMSWTNCRREVVQDARASGGTFSRTVLLQHMHDATFGGLVLAVAPRCDHAASQNNPPGIAVQTSPMNFWKVAPLDSAVDWLEMRYCSEAYRSAQCALVFTDELTSSLGAFFSRALEQDAVSWTNCTNWTMFLRGSDDCGPADGCGPVQEEMCSVAYACTCAGIVLFDPPACPAGPTNPTPTPCEHPSPPHSHSKGVMISVRSNVSASAFCQDVWPFAGKATTDRRAFFVVRSYTWRVRRCCWRVINGGHRQIAEAFWSRSDAVRNSSCTRRHNEKAM